MPSNKIYKIANEIAPDRAAQGDQYDMKIDAIIKYLDSASEMTTGISTAVTNTVAATVFDKTIVIPKNTLLPGNNIKIKALLQTTKAVATHTFTLALKLTPAGGAAVTLATKAAIDPADGAVVNAYTLDVPVLVRGSGVFMAVLPGTLWDFSAATSIAVNPADASFASLALDPTVDNTLSLTVTWSAANIGDSVELHNIGYSIG